MVKATSRAVHHEFSRFLNLAHDGQQIIITKRGKPWASLTPVRSAKTRKVSWPNIVERIGTIKGGGKVEAVKDLIREREAARW